VQTRDATHLALRALIDGDLKSFVDHTLEQRHALSLPPFSYLAQVSGEGVDRVEGLLRKDLLVQVARLDDSSLLVKASSYADFDGALAAAGVGPGGDVRVARDPQRV